MDQVFLINPVKIGGIQSHCQFPECFRDYIFYPLVPVHHITGFILQEKIGDFIRLE